MNNLIYKAEVLINSHLQATNHMWGQRMASVASLFSATPYSEAYCYNTHHIGMLLREETHS